MNQSQSKAIKIFLLLISVIFISISCNHHDEHHAKAKYFVANPWKENVVIEKKYVASLSAIQHIEIRAFEKGYLQEIFVDEGQLIQKGQKMFQVMPMILEAEFKKYQAEYDLASIEYNNTKNLQEKKVVSKNELALSKAKLDKARAELDLAKGHLDLATVKAPFDGIMDKFEVRLGSLIEEGELLTHLADNSHIWAYFNVSEVDYLEYMEQKKNNEIVEVQLQLANGKIFNYKGKIDTIEADFDRETGNVAFRATFPNPEGLLRHGETGNIILKEPIKNAMVIPQKATFEILDKRYVYVVDENNKVQSKEVKVSHEVPHLFVLNSGLGLKEKVLLEGHGKVRPGDVIDTEQKDSKTVITSLELPLK